MKNYNVWWDDIEKENSMEQRHLQGWFNLINSIEENDLKTMNILDFGCNRGGFLKSLYKKKPFKYAIGIDLGKESIALANSKSEDYPIDYIVSDSPESLDIKFDIIFSTSVLYLIDNLQIHALKIKQSLTENGSYYFTYTDMNNNKSFNNFKRTIESTSKLNVNNHKIDEIVNVFHTAGFKVKVMRNTYNHFIEFDQDDYFLTVQDKIQAQYEDAYIFKVTVL